MKFKYLVLASAGGFGIGLIGAGIGLPAYITLSLSFAWGMFAPAILLGD